MNRTALMNFLVDKENKKINVERSFDAPLTIVWDAWTKAEILNQWWAPKPWKAGTKSQEFKEGGFWHYYMEGPNGERHYCLFEYQSITPQKNYAGLDAFCDEQMKLDTSMPRMHWSNTFASGGDTTTVNIVISYDKVEDMEKIIEMGFKEGFSMGLQNLDEWLEQNAKKG